MNLRVATFNVFHDYPFLRHVEARFSLLVDGLASEAPDVVLLQEVSVSEAHGHLPNRLVTALAERGLVYEILYGAANGSVADGGSFEEGSAILSRHPIVAGAAHRLAADRPLERELHGYRFVEQRIALRATLALPDGEPIDVFGAHLTDAPPQANGRVPRREQIEDLERLVRARPTAGRPAIVGGDFNADPGTPEMAWLVESGFRDLAGTCSPFATNDRNDRDLEAACDSSDQRIDYVFAAPPQGETVLVVAARPFLAGPVPRETGGVLWASDHNGVVADVEIQRLPSSSS